jgi:hypothetical protein
VPTTDEDRAQLALTPEDCLRLLRGAAIGRLAYTSAALPAIRPVSFRLREEGVLIPARVGGALVHAVRGAVVAFQTDDFDSATRTGWSVTVVGPSLVLRGQGPGLCLIAVRLGVVRGWRTFAIA